MTALNDLYQQLIIDHSKNPRNFREVKTANHVKEGNNPLCGDSFKVFITEKNGVIEDVCFQGQGCAISTASASLMTENLKGRTVDEAKELFKQVHELITHGKCDKDLGKLAVLSGVSEYPARVKCASLAWHTMYAAIHDDKKSVSTE